MTDISGLPPEQQWPKRVILYAHGSDEGLWDLGIKLGLAEGDPQGLFRHALDEFKLTMDVKEDGNTRLIAVDGKAVLDAQLSNHYTSMNEQVVEMAKRKDFAYMERNMLVAFLASMYPSGIRRTNIEGWDPEWHGCVYIDTPAGQMSWHYHDSQAAFFEGLPPYTKEYDGHTTEQKYERLGELRLINMGFGDAQRKDTPPA